MFAAWDSRGWCGGSKPGLGRLPWVVPSFLSPHWRALHNPDKQINNTTNKRRMWFKMPQLQKKKKDKGQQQGTFCRMSTQIHQKASSKTGSTQSVFFFTFTLSVAPSLSVSPPAEECRSWYRAISIQADLSAAGAHARIHNTYTIKTSFMKEKHILIE